MSDVTSHSPHVFARLLSKWIVGENEENGYLDSRSLEVLSH